MKRIIGIGAVLLFLILLPVTAIVLLFIAIVGRMDGSEINIETND